MNRNAADAPQILTISCPACDKRFAAYSVERSRAKDLGDALKHAESHGFPARLEVGPITIEAHSPHNCTGPTSQADGA